MKHGLITRAMTAVCGAALLLGVAAVPASGTVSREIIRPADGSFIATVGEGRVYQIVGGAPIYVDSWAAVGGVKPYTWVDALVVREASDGDFYQYHFNPPAVRSGLRSTPVDGTFVATHGEGRVYQFVGGAPIYVDSWARVGGVKPFTWVSPNAVANAGTFPWSNVNRQPRDNTFVATVGEGRVYQFLGGAPVYLDSWSAVGGVKPYTWVTPSAVNQAGTGMWSSLQHVPADGTTVATAEPAGLYVFVGGAPLQMNNWGSSLPSPPIVSPTIITAAGTGPWSAFRTLPKDGTFVALRGDVYRFAGGQPMYVDSWAPLGGVHPYTVLPSAGIAHDPVPGRPGPVDGTFVATTDGRVYRYAGGAPFYVTDWASVGGPKPATVVSSGAVDLAGVPGPWHGLPALAANGTFVSEAGTGTGATYVMVGGAPIYIDDWAPWGGPQPAVAVSAQVLRTPGVAPWSGIRTFPVDGTLVAAGTSYYRFQGGRLVAQPLDWYVATTVPAGLPAGAGAAPWSSILPPV